jgi:hypothetical protein
VQGVQYMLWLLNDLKNVLLSFESIDLRENYSRVL